MKIKKWAGLLLAGVIIITSMTGCLGNFYTKAMTIEGEEVPAGLYLMMQMVAYNEASGKVEDSEKDVLKQKIPVEEEEAEDTSSTSESAPVSSSASSLPDESGSSAASGAQSDSSSSQPEDTREKIPATDWIRNRTEELLREYVVIQKLAKENGITLSEEGQKTVEENLQYWPMMEEYYASNGVGEETIQKYLENIALRQDVFNYYYGEGGEKAPTREEIETFAYKDSKHLYGFEIVFGNEDGSIFVGKSEEVKNLLDEAYQSLQDGKITIGEAGDKYYKKAQDLVDAQIADQQKAEEEDGETPAEDETAEDGGEEPAEFMQDWYVGEDDETGYYSKEFLEELKTAKEGDIGRYEGSESEMIYEVVPLFRTQEEYEEQRDGIVGQMKSDEFEDFVKELAKGYTVEKVPGAQWYLSPKKIVTQ